jgi:3-oxoadipate enol-lactonase
MLSNSLGTDLGMWDEPLPWLVDRFQVLRYDERGHGRSPAPPGPYTIADLAGDALDLLDRLGLERVSFCGVSLGGITGMWLAVNAPDRLDRLALCCTSAHLPRREPWTERAATVRVRSMEAVVETGARTLVHPGAAERRPDAVERTRRALLDVSRRATPAAARRLPRTTCAPRSARSVCRRWCSPPPTISRTPPEHGRLIAEAIEGAGSGGARARSAPGRCGAAR